MSDPRMPSDEAIASMARQLGSAPENVLRTYERTLKDIDARKRVPLADLPIEATRLAAEEMGWTWGGRGHGVPSTDEQVRGLLRDLEQAGFHITWARPAASGSSTGGDPTL